MKLKFQGHEALNVEAGKVSVMLLNNTKEYFRLINCLNDNNAELVLFDDNYEIKEINRSVAWDADVVMNDAWQDKYVNLILKQLSKQIIEPYRSAMQHEMQRLCNVAQEGLYQYDLPLELDYFDNLLRIYKVLKVHVVPSALSNPYGIILTDLKFHLELNDCDVIALNNIGNYLTADEICELTAFVKDSDLALLLIEFSEMSLRNKYGNADVLYIDEDFIDWHL